MSRSPAVAPDYLESTYAEDEAAQSALLRRRLQQALAELGPHHPLPPPSRPSRPLLETYDAGLGLAPEEPHATLTDGEIVRALAAAAAPPTNHVTSDGTLAAIAADAAERPPMMIERAIAAQASGGLAIAAAPRLSPWPGLISGFSLALITAAVLYLVIK